MIILDKHIIGNRVLMARKRSNLTQAEAAEKAGICDKTFANIERGRSNMSLASLCSICTALGITPDQLLVSDPESSGVLPEDLILSILEKCNGPEKEGAAQILTAYMDAIQKNTLK